MIDLPAPAVQGLQNTGICREGKDQTVGPQRLEFAVVAPVVPIPAVFSVPQQRVACCGELGADLSLTKEFLKMGVDELSVSPGRVLPIRKVIVESSCS